MHVSIAILGADLQLAALPATPIQLLHAARVAGFDAALPASLGDELVAEEALRLAQARGRHPVVLCACPRLPADLAGGEGLGALAIATCPPPVALARALRLGQRGAGAVHVTYIGACPGAVDPAIDLRIPPDAFLRGLASRGIDLLAQPTEFTDRLPPDRRRFRADAGGAPTAEQCEALLRRALVTPAPRPAGDPRLALADALLAGGATFVDPAPLFACHCAGAAQALRESGGAEPPRVALTAIEGRARLAALEPPRAASPVIAGDPALDLRPTAALVEERPGLATPATAPRPVAPPTVEPAAPARPTPTAAHGATEPATARTRFALARRARQRLVARADVAPAAPGPVTESGTGDALLPSLHASTIEREVPFVPRPTPADAPPSVTAFFDGVVAPLEI